MYFSFHLRGKRLIISIFLFIFFGLLIMNYRNISIPSNTNDMEFKVVIDAGHGSIDTGTSYGEILEKEINLEIAKLLSQEFRKFNIIPIMTRTEDKLYKNSRNKDLRNRPIIANQSRADLFISIHANNFPSSQPSGSQIFYKIKSDESKKLAEFIQSELVNIRKENNRSIKHGDYYVLNKINCPGVLIEVGFLSNPEDRKILSNNDYQKQIAQAITKGIINHFQNNFSKQKDKNSIRNNQDDLKTPVFDSKSGSNKLYFLSNTDKNLFLIKSNLAFPTNSFFDERFSNLNFNEILAISAIEQLLNPPQGLVSPLPKGTQINALSIDNRIAELDLSLESAINFEGGSSMEYNSIKALTKTLLSFKGIDGVKILIDGKEGASLGGHIILNQIFKS